MQVAELLHLGERRPLFHQLLFRLHDFGGFHLAERLSEIGTHTLQVLARAEPPEVTFELFRALAGGDAFGFSRYRGDARRHFALNGKSRLDERGDHVQHLDAFHLRALRNGHELSNRVEHRGLFDLAEAQFIHNIRQLRVLRDKLVHRAAEVD